MRQRIIIIVGIAVVALVVVGGALGAALTTTATIGGNAGGLAVNMPANPTFTDTLDGTDQTASYAPVLGVVDPRGTGAGWNHQISATSFTSGSHTLAPGTVTGATQACTTLSTCTAAVNSGITLPLTITSAPAKFFNSALLSGLGKIDVTPTIAVAIPGNSYAGTYTSTVTLAVTAGP
jgi:hypothetical protein